MNDTSERRQTVVERVARTRQFSGTRERASNAVAVLDRKILHGLSYVRIATKQRGNASPGITLRKWRDICSLPSPLIYFFPYWKFSTRCANPNFISRVARFFAIVQSLRGRWEKKNFKHSECISRGTKNVWQIYISRWILSIWNYLWLIQEYSISRIFKIEHFQKSLIQKWKISTLLFTSKFLFHLIASWMYEKLFRIFGRFYRLRVVLDASWSDTGNYTRRLQNSIGKFVDVLRD